MPFASLSSEITISVMTCRQNMLIPRRKSPAPLLMRCHLLRFPTQPPEQRETWCDVFCKGRRQVHIMTKCVTGGGRQRRIPVWVMGAEGVHLRVLMKPTSSRIHIHDGLIKFILLFIFINFRDAKIPNNWSSLMLMLMLRLQLPFYCARSTIGTEQPSDNFLSQLWIGIILWTAEEDENKCGGTLSTVVVVRMNTSHITNRPTTDQEASIIIKLQSTHRTVTYGILIYGYVYGCDTSCPRRRRRRLLMDDGSPAEDHHDGGRGKYSGRGLLRMKRGRGNQFLVISEEVITFRE